VTDTPETPGDEPQDEIIGGGVSQRVEPVGLEVEVQRSFLDYAMSVIVSRALPDAAVEAARRDPRRRPRRYAARGGG
jgi:hypothetical protein